MKYKISLKRLYVAEKKGTPTGYGTSPEKAFIHAKQRHESAISKAAIAKQERYARDTADGLRTQLLDLIRKNERLVTSNNELKEKVFSLQKENTTMKGRVDHTSRKEWLMYAIAYNGSLDALAAIRRMQSHGAIITKDDIDLAEMVQGELCAFSKAVTKKQAQLKVV